MNLKQKTLSHFHLETALPLAFVLYIPLSVFATVSPTIEQLVERSDVVAIGYVRRYMKNQQVVSLRISKVLKNDSRTTTQQLRRQGIMFVHSQPIKGINWDYYANSRTECLLFLKQTENGTLTISDPLFGVERMSRSVRGKLEALGLGERPTGWSRAGGVVLFFILLNAFFVVVVKLGRKPESQKPEENVDSQGSD